MRGRWRITLSLICPPCSDGSPFKVREFIPYNSRLPFSELESHPNRRLQSAKPDNRHFRDYPPNRTWCGHAKIDANDHNGHDDRNRALSSSFGTEAFADDPGIAAKNDVPKNRRHAEIAILEAMVGEVPQLC
jgi:hypothetical protein